MKYPNFVSTTDLSLERGRKMFRDGKPHPKIDMDQEELTPEVLVWMGWALALGDEFDKRREIIRILEESEPDDLMSIIIKERSR